MPLGSAATAIMNVGWHILGNDRRFARHKKENDKQKERTLEAKSEAYAGFRRWPKTYREVLDRLYRNSDLRRSRSLREELDHIRVSTSG